MYEEQIKLWTIHSPDFSLTDGRVDHNKSEYCLNTPGVKDAYHKLWPKLRIPDGQLIWCYTYDDIKKTNKKIIKYELYVPKSEIICFIDDLVWNRILGKECEVRSDMRHQWNKEACEKFPNNPKASKAYEKKCLENFWAQKPKSGDWWDELFVKSTGEGISALIKHPISSEWIHKSTTLVGLN
jgi:hypothetical protein